MSNLEYIQKNLFILLLLIFTSINSYLIIPLKSYPLYKYNYTTPSEIMKSIVTSKLYAIIEIGTPKQKIEIPLIFNSYEFFISDNPKREFEYDKNNLFSDLNFYLYNESSSWTSYEDYVFFGEYFDYAELGKDSFFFNNSKCELDFYLAYTLKIAESGGIGLIFPPNEIQTNPDKIFFKQIKDKNLINNYVWSIFFNTKNIEKESEGFILIGALPHELDTNLGYYNKNYFQKGIKNVNLETYGIYGTNDVNTFKIDKITVYEGNNKKNIINDFNDFLDNPNLQYIQLDYNSNGVQAPFILLEKYKTIFLNNSNGECFMDIFKYSKSKYFFYCRNKKDVINKIKNIFPGFIFLSRDLDYNFTMDVDDLFLEKEGYVFCLLYFHTDIYEKYWIMGKPFLSKYQFSINPDNKQIYFYSQEDEEQDSKGGKISFNVLIIVIIATIIIVAVICFLLFKYYLYDLFIRKKRANELDDDFDYIQTKEDNENQNNQDNPKSNIEIN